ncbi:anchored repeat-type ABC transporter ATP-binding subunit [Microbacterium sp. CFH 90308]|uniref:Anchored repeat-type ABC transporter ATP-binding subunit n=1 Tax=Microbacterium salsuginis TaxID=2722803 RepID=A0ABX1K6Z6_9MICO|nr:anchored repeat-type ABC transporter ATP-binding subunit [Microbacterium sp. CFH 90308]NLP82767.1 anchored repeat-type ABC transporter ATP-binding subunit [Microbacterium sp. CFH 90308]
MTAATLEVTDVDVELAGRPVLHDVSLMVERGELVGLLGPNGAGKTTLLRTILGLVRPSSGQVLVEGRPSKPGRSSLGYVPQRHDFAWDFPISVAEVVATGLTGRLGVLRRTGAAEWEAVADALHRVRMTDLAERPVGQLSGGQRQRVLVARALVLQPAVLLLDEPFTGLDMPTQDLLSELFAQLAREGRAVLMTTHDIPSALYTCDRIALLNRTVVATDSPQKLAADPALWMSAFGVAADSALLRMLKAA